MSKARRGGELPFVFGSRWSRNLRISCPMQSSRRQRRKRQLLLRQWQPGIHSKGNQILPELIDVRKLQPVNPQLPRGFDVLQLVVEEESFFSGGAEAFQQKLVDCRIGLDKSVLVAPNQDVEILDPGKFFQDDFQNRVAHVREDSGLQAMFLQLVMPRQS